jgi:hypothetical protein
MLTDYGPDIHFCTLYVSGYFLFNMCQYNATRFKVEIIIASTVKVTVVCYSENEACSVKDRYKLTGFTVVKICKMQNTCVCCCDE